MLLTDVFLLTSIQIPAYLYAINPRRVNPHRVFPPTSTRKVWHQSFFAHAPSHHHLLRLHINLAAPTTLIPLGRKNLIIMRAQPHPICRPRIEVILHIDTARTALTLPNTPILLKGANTINRRLVSASRHSNVVGSAVGSDSALALRVGGGVVCAVGFDDVVFNERVAGPAVNGEVAVALGLEGTAVVDGPWSSISIGMEKSRM
jgi:hypothetical protein